MKNSDSDGTIPSPVGILRDSAPHLAADEGHRGEQALELYPLAAPLHYPELAFAGLLHQADLLVVRDLQVEYPRMDLLDYVLPGQTVLGHGLLQQVPGADVVPVKRGGHDASDDLRIGQTRSLVDQVEVDPPSKGCGHLERVHRPAHVSARDVHETVQSLLLDIHVLVRHYPREVVVDLPIGQGLELEHRASRLDGIDDLRGIVA